MKISTSRAMTFIIVLAAIFSLLGIAAVSQFVVATVREGRSRLLQQELKTADAIADDNAAAAAYKKLHPAIPEIQLRILQRQWRVALELLNYMQRARYNPELQNETDAYGRELKSLLDEMLDRCGGMLADVASLRSDMEWQVYNMSGSAKLLRAYMMLESGENADKVQGVVRDALIDYKAAIEVVDKAGAPPFQRNIPRWNFELLNGEQYIKKIELAMTDVEKNQLLKDNLETVLPEMGGYAPGEPIETRIRK